jgi:hypothetical protein
VSLSSANDKKTLRLAGYAGRLFIAHTGTASMVVSIAEIKLVSTI